MSGKAIIFSAPSGAGKTTIVHHLLQQDLNLEFSISATSRSARKVERDGKDYHYMSILEFQEHIEKEAFVEWEEVYEGNFYGTLKSEIERIWAAGKHVIFDVDVVGGLNLKAHFGDSAFAVFVQPPSILALENRLRLRETESHESIVRRICKAEKELDFAHQFDYILINDDLDKAKKDGVAAISKFLEL